LFLLFTQGHIESAVPKRSKNDEMEARGPAIGRNWPKIKTLCLSGLPPSEL
jgi:hypothetical protein